MAFIDLLDHRADVLRPTEEVGDMREVVIILVPVSEGVRAAVVPERIRLGDPGPGEKPTGRVEIYLEIAAVVTERDIVRLTSGANAPSDWRVVSHTVPSGRRRLGRGGHHHEVVVEPWHDSLPEEDS